MLSSTIRDLLEDREAVYETLLETKIVLPVGVTPVVEPANNASPYFATIRIAEQCNLYVLILGGRYGYKAEDGKSATELEFEAAYLQDPTKILIFRRKVNRVDKDQKAFIKRISQYESGFYIYTYSSLDELKKISLVSFRQWLTDRAGIGKNLNYFDHFLRIVIQRTPFPNVFPTYAISDDHIELKYKVSKRIFSVHFDKSHIYKDFWGNVKKLDQNFDKWRKEI